MLRAEESGIRAAVVKSERYVEWTAALPLGMPSLNIGAVVCLAELLDTQGEGVLARRLLAFTIAHPMTNAPDRDEVGAMLAGWGRRAGDEVPWPGITLDELLQRIVAEAPLAHAPLIAALHKSAA